MNEKISIIFSFIKMPDRQMQDFQKPPTLAGFKKSIQDYLEEPYDDISVAAQYNESKQVWIRLMDDETTRKQLRVEDMDKSKR